MNLKDEMSEVCGWCDEKASLHRLTSKGALYCMELNDKGKVMVKQREHNHIHWDESMVYYIPVRFLVRGSFPKGTGSRIWDGIHSHVRS